MIEVIWDKVWQKQWRDHLASLGLSPIEQSWSYGAALNAVYGSQVRRGVFYDGEQPIAIAQIIKTKRLSKLLRAPLFLPGASEAQQHAVYQHLRDAYRKRQGRFLLWLPETRFLKRELTHLRLQHSAYQSAYLDLSKEAETLLANCTSKWRNQWRKSQQSALDIGLASTTEQVNWFFDTHEAQRQQNRFPAPAKPLAMKLYTLLSGHHEAFLHLALKNDQPIAGVLTLAHGQTATYFMAITTSKGREYHAHNALLWHSVLAARQAGYKYYDLGGLDVIKMPGVTRFKEGLCGKSYKLNGLFI